MDWFQLAHFFYEQAEEERTMGDAMKMVKYMRIEINFERVAAQRPELILGVTRSVRHGPL